MAAKTKDIKALEPALLRTSGAVEYLQLSKSTIYNLEKNDKTFPVRFRVGPKSSAFLLHELKNWALAQAQKRSAK